MFTDNLKDVRTKYGVGGGGDYFNFQDGVNRIRILAGGDMIAKHNIARGSRKICFGIKEGCPYHGENAPKNKEGKPTKPSIQGIFYVIDQENDPDRILLAFLPYSVLKYMDELSINPEYAFSELPMKYDLIIKYNSKATDAKDYYVVTPARAESKVSEKVLEDLKKKTSTLEIKKKMEEKQAKECGINLYSDMEEIDSIIQSENKFNTPDLDYNDKPEEDLPF